MINFFKIIENLKKDGARDGYGHALIHFVYYAGNKILNLRSLEIVCLTRANLIPLDQEKYKKHSSRLATLDDLIRMQSEGKWDITQELLEGFKYGDSCVLSFVDEKISGYTWVHTAGHPKLVPGLKISIPEKYAYNYASFTLPEFRGYGLQPYRHHAILSRPEWASKEGMIGFVEGTNWSSKKGQAKSGYQRVGFLTLIGSHDHYSVLISKEVKKIGIRRIK